MTSSQGTANSPLSSGRKPWRVFFPVFIIMAACGDTGTGPFGPSVETVEITPEAATLTSLGETLRLRAEARDSMGNVLSGRAFEWTTTATAVATVSSSGVVTSTGNGRATIRATLEGVSGTAAVTVEQEAVSITVIPESATLREAGETLSLSADARDANGHSVTMGITWNSSRADVATVTEQGDVEAVDDGITTITATVGGVSATADVSVVITGTPRFSAVAAGFSHSCAVTVAGVVYCWGANGSGQLGDGSTARSLRPTQVVGGLTFESISAGHGHTCGVTQAEEGYCWGGSNRGQVGDAALGQRTQPALVAGGRSFVFITAGRGHTCGLTAEGLVRCWGGGSNGELGNGEITNRSVPDSVSGQSRHTSVGGWTHTVCAVRTTGETDCWGRNNTGQVGDGTVTCTSLSSSCFDERATPTMVTTGVSFVSVTSGARIINGFGGGTSCGVTDTGEGYCWGRNTDGQIGDGSQNQRVTPALVSGDHEWNMIDVGSTTTCGVTAADGAYCWGFNGNGVVGDGTGTSRLVPTEVQGGIAYSQISVGFDHACGLTAGGRVYCWGQNSSGQLGNGTTTPSGVPVRITSP